MSVVREHLAYPFVGLLLISLSSSSKAHCGGTCNEFRSQVGIKSIALLKRPAYQMRHIMQRIERLHWQSMHNPSLATLAEQASIATECGAVATKATAKDSFSSRHIRPWTQIVSRHFHVTNQPEPISMSLSIIINFSPIIQQISDHDEILCDSRPIPELPSLSWCASLHDVPEIALWVRMSR